MAVVKLAGIEVLRIGALSDRSSERLPEPNRNAMEQVSDEDAEVTFAPPHDEGRLRRRQLADRRDEVGAGPSSVVRPSRAGTTRALAAAARRGTSPQSNRTIVDGARCP